MRYYRVAWITFFCLAIEQTADTSFLSGKGMGYCMLIGLCLNANRNMLMKEDEEDNGETDNFVERKVRKQNLRDDYWVYHKKPETINTTNIRTI